MGQPFSIDFPEWQTDFVFHVCFNACFNLMHCFKIYTLNNKFSDELPQVQVYLQQEHKSAPDGALPNMLANACCCKHYRELSMFFHMSDAQLWPTVLICCYRL